MPTFLPLSSCLIRCFCRSSTHFSTLHTYDSFIRACIEMEGKEGRRGEERERWAKRERGRGRGSEREKQREERRRGERERKSEGAGERVSRRISIFILVSRILATKEVFSLRILFVCTLLIGYVYS